MGKENLRINFVEIDSLKASVYNPRKWDDVKKAKLRESIERFGLVNPLIANSAPNRKNILIGGHFRLKVAKEMGYKEVPVVYLDIPDIEKEKELNLRLNKNTGEWDLELLKEFDLGVLLEVGFDDDDLSQIWDDSLETEDDNFQEEKELEKIEETEIKSGDLFEIGSHRLLCGDAHDPENIKRLMGGEKTSMIYTDPIYNIGVSYNKGISGNKSYGGKVDDNKSDSEYREFLRSGMRSAMSVANKAFHYFCYCDQRYIGMVQDIFRELGIENKRVCMWIKNAQNPTPGVAFSKCYEPCVYGTVGSPYLSRNLQNLNEVMNKEIGTGNRLIDDILDELDIWLAKRLAGNEYEHSTSKPPTLHEKAIRRCSKPGDVILDLYGGSGSTLIAAEMLKRRAYLTEIEPKFCQLIINRHEKLTGRKAKLINNTKTNDKN
ncbi:MAG: DNA modification methylase [Candidatus Moranbacteria bacterium]|nr:DNA modification methylase [Candidatus Moranbacteria bacterium]